MKIDLNTYTKSFTDNDLLNKYNKEKDTIYKALDNDTMNGWYTSLDLSFLDKIFKLKEEVLHNSCCLVVIGIGGSYLGSRALYQLFTPYFKKAKFPVIYAGVNLSSSYMNELLEYLENVDFSVNVISKSGTTMETDLTYSLIKRLLKKKYSSLEVKKRIIITTDATNGNLREEVKKEGYQSFSIPSNIGGRYSLLTPAHLFPLSFNIDINKLIEGYKEGLTLKEEAFSYATLRRTIFDMGKAVESFVSFEDNWYYYLEWLKQLFGESEGKDGKGILPISMIYPRDLHSLGQFIQDGNKIVFETFFKINKKEECKVDNKDLHIINNTLEDAVMKAHYKGNVPCILIELDKVTPKTIGKLSSFFFLAAAYSAYLFNVNPFNQPGVEVYKEQIKLELNK